MALVNNCWNRFLACMARLATATGETEEQEKLARKRHGSNDYKNNIPEW